MDVGGITRDIFNSFTKAFADAEFGTVRKEPLFVGLDTKMPSDSISLCNPKNDLPKAFGRLLYVILINGWAFPQWLDMAWVRHFFGVSANGKDIARLVPLLAPALTKPYNWNDEHLQEWALDHNLQSWQIEGMSDSEDERAAMLCDKILFGKSQTLTDIIKKEFNHSGLLDVSVQLLMCF
jgi:hypothetical protein